MSTIKLRRDTAANWSAANPILSLAEPGLETDTNKIKYGDGLTSWAGLPYASGGASTSTRWDAVPAQEGCPIYAELTPDHFQAFTQQSNLGIRNDGSWNIGSNYNGTGLYGSGNTATLYSNSGDVAIRVNDSQSLFTFGADGNLTLPGNIQSPNSIGINVPNFPTLASKTTAIMSNGTVTTVSNFTTPSQSVIVIASGAETSTTTNTVSSIVSIVGLGLMWTRRAQYLDPASSNNQQAEVWYAINSSGNPITDNIVITFDNPVDDQGTVVSSYVGCNLDTPWTASGPFYSNSTDPSTNSATITMSIAEPHSAGIVFFGVPWYQENADGTGGTGFAVNWSNVAEADNGGAVLWEYDELSYRQFNLPQTDLVVTSTYSGTGTQYSQSVGLTVIADALVGNGGTSNWTINNGLAFPDGTLQTTAWNGSIPTRWDAVPVEADCPIYTELTSDHFFAYTQNSHLALENAGDWNLGSNSNGTYIFAVGNTTTIYSNIGDVVISLNNSQSNFIFGLDGNLTIPAGGVISDSTDYLTTRNLHIQGALQGVDGSTGSTGQVLTRQSNGGVAWADSTGGGASVVNRSVEFPQGVAGDTAGTIANDEGTLYFSTADYVTQVPTNYSFTSTETVLNSQDINGNMDFSFTIADNPSLAAALFDISVANGTVQLSSPALDGVRTTAPGAMNYNTDNTTFGIQVPYQSGDPTEIDIGTPFTVTLTPPQPAIWEHISTTGTGNITFNNNIISTAQGQVIDIKTTTSSGDDNELFIGSDNIDLYVFNNTQGSGAELYLNNTNNAQPYAYIGVQPHNGSEQYWTFNPDGSIVFPDTTVQTTAYTGPTNVDPHIWAVQATSTTKYSNTQAVAYDSQGNSFALMAQGPQNGGSDYRSSVIKLDTEGNTLWAIELTDGQEVDPWSLVCDANNDVYAVVAHYVNNIYNNNVIKLSGSNGSILWQIDIQDSQSAKNMQAVPFTVSGQPGIIVAGTAYNGTDNDFFIVFIQADGTVPIPASLWGDQYDQEAYSVATDGTGDILLVGVKEGVADNAYYLEMAKFTYGTGIVWQKSVTVDGNYDVKGTDVCLLADGNWAIIATHQIDNTGNTWGIITMKVNNTDGTVMWSREVNAGCSGISSSIASDAAGNIYISATTFTGDTSTNGGNIPIAARLYAAYNSSGTSLWQKYLRCPGNNWVVDNNWWNGIGSTGKLIAVYNDKLLLGFSQSPLNPYPGATTGVIAQLTLLGENETIGPFSTSNSYLSDSAITLTLADTTFNFSTGPQTFATGTSISTDIATLTYNKFNAGATSTRWDATPTESGDNCPIYAELTPDHFQAFTQQSNLGIRNDGSWNIGSNYNGTGLYGSGNTATLYSNSGDVAIRVNDSQSLFTFGADGNLTFPDGNTRIFHNPDNGILYFDSGVDGGGGISFGTTSNTTIVGSQAVEIDAGFGNETTYHWTFGTDGTLTFPDSSVQTTAYLAGSAGVSINSGTNFAEISTTTFTIETSKYSYWIDQFGDLTNNSSSDYGNSLVYDSQGNVIVAMVDFTEVANNDKPMIVKYNPQGEVLWKQYVSDGSGSYQIGSAESLDVDADDNIYLLTNDYDSGSSWVFQLSPTGDLLNQQEFTLTSNNAYDIVVDHSGNFYVTSISYNNPTQQIAVIKGNFALGIIWQQGINYSASSGSDSGYSIDLDGASPPNIYVAGQTDSSSELVKLNSNGDVQWAVSLANSYACALAVDHDGNSYVLGGGSSEFIVKYDTNGNVIWQVGLNSSLYDTTEIRLGPDGYLYATGTTGDGPFNNAIWIAKFDTDGNQLWVNAFSNFASYDSLTTWNFNGHKDIAVRDGVFAITAATENPAHVNPNGYNPYQAITFQFPTDGTYADPWDSAVQYQGYTYFTLPWLTGTNVISLTTGSGVFTTISPGFSTSTNTVALAVSTQTSDLKTLVHGGIWEFTQSGNIKFPDGTLQSTAYTGPGTSLGEFKGQTASNGNYGGSVISVRNAAGYKRIDNLGNSQQVWFSTYELSQQLGVSQYYITSVTIDFQATSSGIGTSSDYGTMVGQISAAYNFYNGQLSITHSETAIMNNGGDQDAFVFANLDMWNDAGSFQIAAIRTDSQSGQQLDIVWTAKVFINPMLVERYC